MTSQPTTAPAFTLYAAIRMDLRGRTATAYGRRPGATKWEKIGGGFDRSSTDGIAARYGAGVALCRQTITRVQWTRTYRADGSVDVSPSAAY
jgi:hypothetical protein